MSARFRSRFPTYNALDKWDSPSWNEQTRAVVRKRLEEVPEQRFFTESEWNILTAVCNRLIPQPDRPVNPVPIVPFIDAKLFENDGVGYRYADMPPMREAWRRGVAAIDAEAQTQGGAAFNELAPDAQDAVLRAIQQGDVKSPAWGDLPARRFFSNALMDAVVSVYYAHPAAWSEIGFGGPAAPRGYVRMGIDRRDSWEAVEGK